MMFSAVVTEEAVMRITVQQGLSVLSMAYKQSPPAVKATLLELLLNYTVHGDAKARRCAVEWAASIYPFNNVPGMYHQIFKIAV